MDHWTEMGQYMYRLYQQIQLALNACSTDAWDDLGSQDQLVWAELARTTEFEMSDDVKKVLGVS